ncbi:nucleotide exchange factor GrpE [Patescibacteria group bacterium]|nr:nucleotide exchange factor GrpE [Patescibacteria group bacterium]
MDDAKKIKAKKSSESEKKECACGGLKEKCDEYLNGWKRAQADYQNLLKESERKNMEFVKYANSELIIQLLPILDNFKAAFKQIPEAEKESAWVVGFSYIKKQLEDLLRENGVEEIKTIGAAFDYNEHEAVGHAEKEEMESGEIVEEKKAGYKLNGKVIQAAKVVVNE